MNRLHAALVQLVPGGAPIGLTADAAAALLRPLRPTDATSRTRQAIAVDLVADVRRLDRQLKALEADITAAVKASDSTLTELFGIGPVLAARIIGRTGDIARFPSEGHFATYCGVAPIEVSSGDGERHRLSRAGDRKLNHALHIMALVQARSHDEGRAYYQRKRAAGKTHAEAMRCLKRRLCDLVYRQLVRDANTSATSPGGHTGAATKSSAAGPTPTANSSDKSLPGPANRHPTSTRRRAS